MKNTSSQVVVFLFGSHLYLASCCLRCQFWLCLCLVLALPTLSIIIIINIMANFASASFKRLFNLDFDLANNLCRVIKQLGKSENDRGRGFVAWSCGMRLCNNIADLFCTGRHSGANIMCHFMGQVYSARLSVAIILDRADCTRRH